MKLKSVKLAGTLVNTKLWSILPLLGKFKLASIDYLDTSQCFGI